MFVNKKLLILQLLSKLQIIKYMKKIYVTLMVALTAILNLPAQDLFLRGTMNEWEAQEEWKLIQLPENLNIFTGSFYLEPDQYEFKFADISWEYYNFGYTDFDLYGNYPFLGKSIYNGDNFVINNWMGGELNVTINVATGDFSFIAPDQPDGEIPVITSTLHVCDGTEWDSFYLYIEGISGEVGRWPGIAPEGTSSINGVVYDDFNIEIPMNFSTYEIVFNDGGNNQISLDYNPDSIIQNPDTYINVRAGYAYTLYMSPHCYFPLDSRFEFYLRGSMTDWDALPEWAFSLEFEENGFQKYVVTNELPEGSYEFKIGDANWKVIDLGAFIWNQYVDISTPDYWHSISFDYKGYNFILDWEGGKIKFEVSFWPEINLIGVGDMMVMQAEDSSADRLFESATKLSYKEGIVKVPAPSNLTVFNMTGQIMINTFAESVNLLSLPSGSYIVKAEGYDIIKVMR